MLAYNSHFYIVEISTGQGGIARVKTAMPNDECQEQRQRYAGFELMKLRTYAAVFFAALSFAVAACSAMPWLDRWWDLRSAKAAKKLIKFNQIEFALEERVGSCVLDGNASMICTMALTGAGSLEITFEQKMVPRSSLPLVRIMRKRQWFSDYQMVTNYVETEIITGLGKLPGQRGTGYRPNNILRPVLLRAFDVVIDDKTCISISTKCDLNHWPFFEQELKKIEASLARTSRT